MYFSTWLHKHLTKFWNSDRNHRPNALREMFSFLQHSLGRHSLCDLTCWISSGQTICVRDRPGLFYCISNYNWTKLMRHCPIQCNFGDINDLCKLGKKTFNCIDMQITHFILDKILRLSTYHTPFYHQSLQSYLISNTVRFFGPPCS